MSRYLNLIRQPVEPSDQPSTPAELLHSECGISGISGISPLVRTAQPDSSAEFPGDPEVQGHQDLRRPSAEQAAAVGLNADSTLGSIRPLEILEHVESAMGIRLVREGDKLRMHTRPGTDIPAARERVRKLRDILFEEVLQREYVELVCAPLEHFDYARADGAFEEWQRLYSTTDAPTRPDATRKGD